MLHYVLESNDNDNLISFLIPLCAQRSKFSKQKVFVKFLNSQFKEITGGSLFEHYIQIWRNEPRFDDNKVHMGVKFFGVISTLLEECVTIRNIRDETPIERLLEMSAKGCCDKTNEFHPILMQTDDLLGYFVAYWSRDDPNYNEYKARLLGEHQLSPLFEILFMIIEDEDDSTFKEKFLDNFERIERSCRKRYSKTGRIVEISRANYLFLTLLTAILKEKQSIIDYILKYETFATIKIGFPPNIRNNQTTKWFALRMLEEGYFLGRNAFPSKWITPENFKNFLDSRIIYDGEELIELDCLFLLDDINRQYQISDVDKIDDVMIYTEDTTALEYIANHESLEGFILHPTVATYVDLKMHKFQSIYWWDFWVFFLFIIIPFGCLVTSYFVEGFEYLHNLALYGCIFAIFCLVSREVFQYLFIDKTWINYRKRVINFVEILLILISIVTVVMFWFKDYFHEEHIKVTSVVMMLLLTFDLLATLRAASMPFYFIMLRKVGLTFFKFFFAFVLILLAFTLSFWVVFETKAEFNRKAAFLEDEDKKIFKNFLSIPSAFLKVIIMMSGEYGIEPFTLSSYQMVFMLMFVITTFILFNLILGLTIDDVQKLKQDARKITLLQNAKTIIETSKFCTFFYEKYVASRFVHDFC